MSEESRNWVAPCGLYCGACTIRLAGKSGHRQLLEEIAAVLTSREGKSIRADDLACEGCLSDGAVAIVCRDCALRACALEKGVGHCSCCPEYPCQGITDFSQDGLPHHAEIPKNVSRQKESGLEAWADEQDRRWRCPQCGRIISWYDSQCSACGSPLSPQFPPPQV
jgi:hypothetical protein